MFNKCRLSRDYLVMKEHFESGEQVNCRAISELSSPFLSDKRQSIYCHWNMVCGNGFGKSCFLFLAVAALLYGRGNSSVLPSV